MESSQRKTEGDQRQEGKGIGNDIRLHGRNNALKGKSHERILYEIRRVSIGRIKASRGCENLKAQVGKRGTLIQVAAAQCRETLEGTRPQGRSHGFSPLSSVATDLSGASVSSRLEKRRLGVWVNSVKEFKPKRGLS